MEEFNYCDEGVERLMVSLIKQSLHDLYKKPIKRKPKNKEDAKKIYYRNLEIEKRRREAKLFFQSDLFKATNLDLDYLLTKYEETL